MKLPLKSWIPTSVIALLALTELTLRFGFGLGNPVLSQADSDTGYRFQPNQKTVRFGRTIEYNQYSQRSEPTTLENPQDKLRILMTGDSVLNGGNSTDQPQTITELFEAQLTQSKHPAEVLNASAGSWGIGNQLGYLRKFGTFQSDALILQIGSHDLRQPTSTSEPVGNHPAYPTHPPLLATQEAITRYALPRLTRLLKSDSSPTETAPEQLNQQFQENMKNLKAIVQLARDNNIPVFVLYTPDRKDLIPTPETPERKPQFLQLLNSLQVPVIDTQTAWSNLPSSTVQTYFRDGVHLTEAGNKAVADLLIQQLCTESQLPACSPTP